ncbi:tail fiber domain-containing protein [Sinorhizobium meliloti]|uniref:tail fiber domain-containing protein n=1 Tax=Rhizobium meliloti TaxID=382 RepID=UPI000480ECAB|nr:tail fiber domain-containing protein [Sinorhizobium meliloti]MDE4620849.1 tail fiber domain-containing protein [Sinorhizobium meliloti]
MDTASVGSISVTATATNYATSSDYRLKTNVSPLVEFSLTQEQFDLLDDTLLRVMCYRPVSYKWLNDPASGLAHGFIAHELQDVAPHAVTGLKDGEVEIGTAVIPEILVPEQTIKGQAVTVVDPETGETREMQEADQIVPAEVIPGRRIENITREEAPEGSTWAKTGSRPDFQGVDPSKLVPDLVAALQSATVMILEQHKSIDALTARVAALEVANQPS